MNDQRSAPWATARANKKARHRERVESYPRLLTSAGIRFTRHNNGNHLILEGLHSFIDLWPGTDRFAVRTPYHKGIGLKKALLYANGDTP